MVHQCAASGSAPPIDSEIPERLRPAACAPPSRSGSAPPSTRRNSSMGSNSYVACHSGRGAWHARCSLRWPERMCGMRQMAIVVFAVAALVGPMSTSAGAQDKAGHFIIGGGYTAPNSEVRDHLGDGWNFVIGGQYNTSPMIGIEGLYSFNGLGEKRISVPVSGTPGATPVPTDFFADMNMQYGTVNIVLQKPEGDVKPYGVFGAGIYYRPIKV